MYKDNTNAIMARIERQQREASSLIRLQGVGLVPGTPAGQIKEGDILIWNFGHRYRVKKILRTTDATIWIEEEDCNSGKTYERKLAKKRLVAIIKGRG